MNNLTILKRIITKCDFEYNGAIISKEIIIKKLWLFLSDETQNKNKRLCSILHTGSPTFDAIILFYASILGILKGKTDPEKVLKDIKKGTLVLYEDDLGKIERYRFEGFIETIIPKTKQKVHLIKLEQESLNGKTGEVRTLSKEKWNRIRPYFGTSKSLDGRGIRGSNDFVKDFYNEVLECQKPNVINVSSIILGKKDLFDEELDKCSILFGDKRVKLSELITSSYFTENGENRHSGNYANSEPVIKFTCDVEVARKIIVDNDCNDTCGLFVVGDEQANRNMVELQHLMKKKKLPLFVVSSRINSSITDSLFEGYDGQVDYFACTKDKVKDIEENPIENNEYTKLLLKQISNIKNSKQNTKIVGSFLSPKEYFDLKKNILNVKNSDNISDEKDEFVINAFSALKNIINSPITMTEMEKLINDGLLRIESPASKISKLSNLKQLLPDYLKTGCERIINDLNKIYKALNNDNPKENELIDLLSNYQHCKIAIIVNKQSCVDLLNNSIISGEEFDNEIDIFIPKQFDYEKMYDSIICLGDFNSNSFNQFCLPNSQEIITLLYSHETYYYKKSKKDYLTRISKINNISEDIPIDLEEFEQHESDEYREIDNGVESILNDEYLFSNYKRYKGSENPASKFADTIAVATFESGERAFFTRMYKAYVFEKKLSKVKEVDVQSISEGNDILFIRSNEETRDIVDEILVELLTEGKLDKNVKTYYEMSKVWKYKLKKYKKDHRLSTKELAAELKKSGINVIEQTIRGWLDEDAHTVGPREAESIEYIGRFVGDEKLENDYKKYFLACSEIRKVRLKLLDQIGEMILMRISHKKPTVGSIYEKIYEKVEKLGVLSRVESISFINNQIPVNMVNRLLAVKE